MEELWGVLGFRSRHTNWKKPRGISYSARLDETQRLRALFEGPDGEQARKAWEVFNAHLPHVKDRPELVGLLQAYEEELQQHRLARRLAELSAAAPADTLRGSLPRPVSAASGLRLTEADFAAGDPESLLREGREYLRGGAPSPRTAVHVAVPRPDVDNILRHTQGGRPAVIVHGPVAEGVSTVLLQVAHKAVASGRPVFRVRDLRQLETLGPSLEPVQAPLVVVEDAHHFSAQPAWFGDLDAAGGCLLLGAQTRRLWRLRPLFDARRCPELRLERVSSREADAYVDRIVEFQAAGGRDRADITRYFIQGLHLHHGLGGLWPAQFQATRGEDLDRRVRAVLADFDPDSLRVLSALVFQARLHGDGRQIREPSESSVLALLSELDLDLEGRAEPVLSEVVQRLEGEFGGDRSVAHLLTVNDPVLTLRHPALAESLFRWLFGANRQERGDFLFEKWDYHLANVRQAVRTGGAPYVYALLRLMSGNHDYDVRKRELRRRLTVNRPAYPARVDDEPGRRAKFGDVLLFAADEAASLLGEDPSLQRRLDVLRARTLSHAEREPDQEDREQGYDRAVVALASALVDRDSEVIGDVAEVLAQLKRTAEVDGQSWSWLDLITRAEQLEKPRPGGPKWSSMKRLRLLATARPHPPEWRELIVSAARVSDFLTAVEWDDTRLLVLRQLTDTAKRPSGGGQPLLKLGLIGDPFGTSLRSLYAATLIEIRRRTVEQPSFLNLLAAQRSEDFTFNLVKAQVFDWARDEERADDRGEFDETMPDGLVDALLKLRDRVSSSPDEFASGLHRFAAFAPALTAAKT